MASTKPVKRIKLPAKKGESKTTQEEKTSSKAPASAKKQTQGKKRGALFILTPFIASGRYFKQSWQELRQVRWPNRSATWGLTLAVLIFTAFFVLVILALDGGFQYLFKEVLLK